MAAKISRMTRFYQSWVRKSAVFVTLVTQSLKSNIYKYGYYVFLFLCVTPRPVYCEVFEKSRWWKFMVVNTDHDPSFHVRSPSLENMKLKVAVDIYFCCPFYYYFFFFTKYHCQPQLKPIVTSVMFPILRLIEAATIQTQMWRLFLEIPSSLSFSLSPLIPSHPSASPLLHPTPSVHL